MKKMLFNPGPTNVSEDVRDTLKTHDICHREPEFREVLLRANKNLVEVFGGSGTHEAVLFVSSGTGCNEAICASIHGKVLVVNNGKYSNRICEILETYKIPFKRLEFEKTEPIDLKKIEEEFEKDTDITHLYLIHHETTTGALAPLRKIGELCKKYGKIFCVDSVSGLGGHSFDLKKDNIDFCAVSANKCLESFPGVSFVLGKREEIEKLEGKSRSFYFDIFKQWKKEQNGETPFTPAVQLVFAVDKAIQNLKEEGIEERIQRYQNLADKMRKGLIELGFELILLPEEMQSNILTAIKMPDEMDYWKVHDKLKERGITIYSSPGVLNQRRFRVATLGSITEEDVEWFLSNLKEVCEEEDIFKK
jgi:2-aminoethylphosphonate-pyruvate transaminase